MGLIPELLRGQSLQFNLPPPCIPVDYVFLQLLLELFEALEPLAAEELIFHVPEQLLGRAVVYAVAFSRHALNDSGFAQGGAVRLVLVLPSHVALHDRALAVGNLRQEHVEHLHLLRHVRVPGDRPRRYLAAAEVERRREVRLSPRLLEFGDVRAHLLPRTVGGEVAPQHVLEGLADDAFVGVVPVVVGLAANPAGDADLAHHLEHRLVGYAHPLLRAQAHCYLAMAAPVRRPAEDLGGLAPELGPRGPRRMVERVVVGRPGHPGGLQQVGASEPLP